MSVVEIFVGRILEARQMGGGEKVSKYVFS